MKRFLFILALFAVLALATPIAANAGPCLSGEKACGDRCIQEKDTCLDLKLNLTYPKFAGLDINTNQDLGALLKWIYAAIVIISGLAAFVMLVWGGIAWMSSAGSPTAISDARGRIQSALLGLLLVLASFLTLQIINPELTVLNIPGAPALKSTIAPVGPAQPILHVVTPTLIFKVNGVDSATIQPDGSVTLSWSTLNFARCQADSNPSTPPWVGRLREGDLKDAQLQGGVQDVTLTTSTTFSLLCSGAQDNSGSALPDIQKSVSVTVTNQPPSGTELPTVDLKVDRTLLKSDANPDGPSAKPLQLFTSSAKGDFTSTGTRINFVWTSTNTQTCEGKDTLALLTREGVALKDEPTKSHKILLPGDDKMYKFTIICKGPTGQEATDSVFITKKF